MNNMLRPKLILNRYAWNIVLAAWVFIWAFVLCKNLFIKGYFKEYQKLISLKTLEDKRAYVTGSDLYELISDFKYRVPDNSTFNYAGIRQGWLEDRKIRYYLYPHLKSEDPRYIIVFKVKDYTVPPGWEPFHKIDDSRFILKRHR